MDNAILFMEWFWVPVAVYWSLGNLYIPVANNILIYHPSPFLLCPSYAVIPAVSSLPYIQA